MKIRGYHCERSEAIFVFTARLAGGLGTLDELFEVATLIETLIGSGAVDVDELSFTKESDSPDEAVEFTVSCVGKPQLKVG